MFTAIIEDHIVLVNRLDIPSPFLNLSWYELGFSMTLPEHKHPHVPQKLVNSFKKALKQNDDDEIIHRCLEIGDFIAGWQDAKNQLEEQL